MIHDIYFVRVHIKSERFALSHIYNHIKEYREKVKVNECSGNIQCDPAITWRLRQLLVQLGRQRNQHNFERFELDYCFRRLQRLYLPPTATTTFAVNLYISQKRSLTSCVWKIETEKDEKKIEKKKTYIKIPSIACGRGNSQSILPSYRKRSHRARVLPLPFRAWFFFACPFAIAA